jgi:hypothetical protein
VRKSLILALAALGGSASYATAITPIGPDPSSMDPATWRWHVSAILDGQQAAAAPIESASASFEQRYPRYSPVGRLQRQP